MAQQGGTGRYLILLEEGAGDEGIREMTRIAGLRCANTADLAGSSGASVFAQSDGLLYYDLGVAVVTAAADQVEALTRAIGEPGPIAMVESERTVFALESAPAATATEVDESTLTWGLQAIGAADSSATGSGVRVAVLDTGFATQHPDFAGRTVTTTSFIDGVDVEDGHGHGTHCIGTACGPREPDTGPGYGIAYESEIYAGKVLSNEGSGSDGGILAGISWAVQHGCAVVSMSLGASVQPGEGYSQTYERIARRALDRGTLIIAAAGNESRRADGHIAPVGHPANCPSIMAVGAVDVEGNIADFSSATVNEDGAVDIVGPGVDVHSSWTMPTRHRTISGTSMSTPHASGVAALLAQEHGASAWELWARLGQGARRLPLHSTDIGAGLVQAP
jgi:subtilisin family serine protease